MYYIIIKLDYISVYEIGKSPKRAVEGYYISSSLCLDNADYQVFLSNEYIKDFSVPINYNSSFQTYPCLVIANP